MVPDIHAKFEPSNMATFLRTDTKNIKHFFKFNWVTGSPPTVDTSLASWFPTYMQRLRRAMWRHFFGRTHKNTKHFFKFNWVTGSPPTFYRLLASWYPTYMHIVIISYSSCADQYGDMSSDGHKQTLNKF